MIEPYATALAPLVHELEVIGFSVKRDEEYGVQFANGDWKLEFETDKYYQPSISGRLEFRQNVFEIGLLEKVISPERYNKDMQALVDIETTYHLQDGTTDDSRQEGMRLYVEASFKQLADFFHSCRAKLFDEKLTFRDRYEICEQEAFKHIGLPER